MLVLVVGVEVWLGNSKLVKFGDVIEDKREEKVLGIEETKEEEVDREQVKKEIEFWKSVVSAQPTYFDGLVRLSIYYWQIGDKQGAKEYLERAKRVDPGNEVLVEIEELEK